MVLRNINTASGFLAVNVEGDGPLVICAHGMGDDRSAYAPFAKQLVASGYTVANMDTRGHGDSSTSFEQYGDLATADDFLTIVKELNIGPAALAGCSFSAGSATIAAGKAPELVAGIILLGPFLRNPMGPVGMWFMPLLFKWPWGSTVWSFYAPTLWPGLGAEQGKARAKSSTQLLTRPGRWEAFYKTVCGCDHRVVEPWIGKVKCPALVVMGEKDPDWTDPKVEADWVAGQVQSTLLMVEGAGHAPMLESAEVVGRSALEFLRGLRMKGAFGRR